MRRTLIVLSAAILLSGCGVKPDAPEAASTKAEYKKISPAEASEMMSDGAIVLDVRTQGEYDKGHIEGATLLPVGEIRDMAESVVPDKNAVIVVYCRTGVRSESAAKELIAMGYANVFDFGGIEDWPGETVTE